ncbi:MAG TPA: hypothetical protein G4O07_03240 [Dehalococcoidia bacterium]|nr:hypothetical protein [Dehalococcoidia bacterium]
MSLRGVVTTKQSLVMVEIATLCSQRQIQNVTARNNTTKQSLVMVKIVSACWQRRGNPSIKPVPLRWALDMGSRIRV